MTRKELTALTGSVDQTDLAIELLLKHTKPALIRSAIRAEKVDLEAELTLLVAAGYVVNVNHSYSVNWARPEELNGWNLTPEQEAAYDAAYLKCSKAEALLYQRNRVTSLLAKI